jgi:Uma2 family endonuclease
MATAVVPVPAVISLEEYLNTSYHPDCEFVDGVVEERNVGEVTHGLLQIEVGYWFRSRSSEWNIRAIAELRTQVSANRVRLPDITVAYNDAAMKEQVRETPPLIAIEILSPSDRIPRVLVRLADFWKMGIHNIWVLDPIDRVALVYTENGLRVAETERLTVADSPIFLDLNEVFSALD